LQDRPLNASALHAFNAAKGAVMSDNKELTKDAVGPDDLDRNPGVGQSKGAFASGRDPQEIGGENTVEGDVDNDSTANDGTPQEERARDH
jgi:hypothetical protein